MNNHPWTSVASLVIATAIAAIIVSVYPWALTVIWDWFIFPEFGVQLSYLGALGITGVFMLLAKNSPSVLEMRVNKTGIESAKLMGFIIAKPFVVLGILGIIKIVVS